LIRGQFWFRLVGGFFFSTWSPDFPSRRLRLLPRRSDRLAGDYFSTFFPHPHQPADRSVLCGHIRRPGVGGDRRATEATMMVLGVFLGSGLVADFELGGGQTAGSIQPPRLALGQPYLRRHHSGIRSAAWLRSSFPADFSLSVRRPFASQRVSGKESNRVPANGNLFHSAFRNAQWAMRNWGGRRPFDSPRGKE